MERPLSQLENIRPSNMKQPSRLPALSGGTVGRTLVETSQSDLNARPFTHEQGLPLPNGSIKHKISGLPEPPTKRKTLAERAGEPFNASKSHIPPPCKATRQDTANSASHNRALSGPTGAGAHRGAGVPRPSSRQHGLRQIGLGRPPSANEVRQVSAESESELGVSGKRKGTPTLNFLSNNFIAIRKRRAPAPPPSDSSRSSSTTMSSRSQHSGSHKLAPSSPSEVTETSEETPLFGSTSSRHRSLRDSHRSVSSASNETERVNTSRQTSLVTAFDNLSLGSDRVYKLHQTPASKSIPTPRRSSPLEQIPEERSPSKIPKYSCTPSLRHAQSLNTISCSSSSKPKLVVDGLNTPASAARRTKKIEMPVFLTKEKLTSTTAWDTKGRLEDMESLYAQLRSQFASAADSKSTLEESLTLYKTRVQDLKEANEDLTSTNRNLTKDLERARNDLHTTTADLRQARRDNEHDVLEAERKHERVMNDLCNKQQKETYQLERELEKTTQQGERDMEEAKRSWEKQKDDALSEMTTQHWDEIEELKSGHHHEIVKVQSELDNLRRLGESRATESAGEVQVLRETMSSLDQQLEVAKTTMSSLRSQVAAAESRNASLEQEKTALVSKTHFLEGNQEAQSLEFTSMSDRLQDAINARNATMETLRKEEMLRRKLNATILELRGNIRVFVRLRPLLSGEEDPAKVEYPDLDSLDGGKEMTVYGSTTLSATGKERREKHDYSFDRVFGPTTANQNVFNDCQDLIQSVVDGYNVSILSYGQTGSGKTYGMSGPSGIIPSAIGLLLSEMQRLKEKGWEYVVVANFVEVYNETLNDLLGDAKTWDEAEDLGVSVRGKKKEKHEIHHDAATGKTSVTNLTSVSLWPPPTNDGQWPPAASNIEFNDASSYTERAAAELLDTAAKNRRVAATKANERSSRSHSVFILTLKGHCSTTGESSEGILNLVDLAGSERLKQSGAEGNRMKETQAINKSLSALGDVIAALGAKKNDDSHVPYRNSKLTYLLQSSLGGTIAGKSSRTLMLLHLSPLQTHWQESRSSLLFGSKVHGTHIGTAKKR